MPRSSGESGVVFIWVLVGMLVMAVMLLAAVQPASIVAKREKEKELIFRGEQYTEAIRLYQAEHGGAFPTELKALLKPGPKKYHYIRRLYSNPFDPEGKWVLLGMGTTMVRTGEDGRPKYITAGGPSPGVARTPTGGSAGTNPPVGGGKGMPQGVTQILPFRIGAEEGQPIVGVLCNLPRKAFQDYRGKYYYNEWFWTPLMIPPPGTPSPGGLRQGQQGQPNQPTTSQRGMGG